uniref:Uncharacterized protein n=1 Tax=Avena sativa TaxID=4498 RepID=A0ACD5W4D0_AVESA
MSCSNADDINLEEVIGLQRDLERYQKDTLRKIKSQQVYHMGMFESRSGLYRISREIELSVLTHPVDLKIVSRNIENELKYCGYKYIHQDEVGLHNLENKMEAMEVENRKRKRSTYGETSVKREGERERSTRSAGKWPPEKDDFQPSYIPKQYRYMGTKRRNFEKPVEFQNTRNDGAILNLAAHDPTDWPNILSIWKGLIVQKYIQNQHNIGTKV